MVKVNPEERPVDTQERDSIVRDANRWLERAKAECSDFDKNSLRRRVS